MAQENLFNENLERVVETKVFRIYAKQYQKKDGKGSFFGFTKVNGKGQSTHQVKCTMECGSLPIKESGYYLLEVAQKAVSLQKGKTVDGKKYYDTLWLQERPISCKRDVDYEAKIKALKEKEVEEILDDNLPF